MSARPPALLFGIPIADLTMDECIALVARLVDEGRTRGRTHHVATVNVDFLVNALDQPDVHGLLQHADLCIADGMPVVWASKLLGMPIAERVAGADLVPLLIERSRTTGHRVHFFGASAAVIESARALIDDRFPGARCTFQEAPMIDRVDRVPDEVLDRIVEADADILCVALGNPKQERFIAEHRDRLRTPVMIGVGGTLDMLTGRRKRAPKWVRRVGLEWVVRAAQEPLRLGRRYARDIRVFGPSLLRERRDVRAASHHPALRLERDEPPVVVRVTGTSLVDPADWAAAHDALLDGAPLRIDSAAADGVRRDAAAQVVGLVRAARRGGGSVSCSALGSPLRSSIESMGVAPSMLGWNDDGGPAGMP